MIILFILIRTVERTAFYSLDKDGRTKQHFTLIKIRQQCRLGEADKVEVEQNDDIAFTQKQGLRNSHNERTLCAGDH